MTQRAVIQFTYRVTVDVSDEEAKLLDAGSIRVEDEVVDRAYDMLKNDMYAAEQQIDLVDLYREGDQR